MIRQFPDDRYLVQIVEPIDKHGAREPLRVDVYRMVERNDVSRSPCDGQVRHMTFVGSFNLHDRFGHNPLSLDEVTEKVYELAKTVEH